MTKRYAILVGGPSDGSKIAVDRFTAEVHVAVATPLEMEPIRADHELPRFPTGVYLAVGGPVRPREYATWARPGNPYTWLPDHEVCMYIFVGERP